MRDDKFDLVWYKSMLPYWAFREGGDGLDFPFLYPVPPSLSVTELVRRRGLIKTAG